MEYFQLLHLGKEPFSNSPDPEFYYPSPHHEGCLQKIELAIRLRRGLNVVFGDVGTGKTTLCRNILHRFSTEEDIDLHLILDPGFSSPLEFIAGIAKHLGIFDSQLKNDPWQLKENIKNYLYEQGVKNNKIVVLIIDEGQKIPDFGIEILREFLNYETNQFKLLQIIIFAQKEFQEIIKEYENFTDRINECLKLPALNFINTIRIIQFRLLKASDGKVNNLFTFPALLKIYISTRGYPRKILHLCHLVLLALIIKKQKKANYFLVRSCIKRDASNKYRNYSFVKILIGVLILGWFFISGDYLNDMRQWIEDQSQYVWCRAKQKISLFLPDESKMVSQTNMSKDMGEVTEVNGNTYPMFLGSIRIKHHCTLIELTKIIYDSATPWYLKYIRMVNPQIDKFSHDLFNQKVYFPSVSIKPDLSFYRKFWLEISHHNTIEQAYSFILDYPNHFPKIVLIPFWNRSKQLQFSCIVRQSFLSQDDAKQFISKHYENLAFSYTIINQWEPETVFFSHFTKNIE